MKRLSYLLLVILCSPYLISAQTTSVKKKQEVLDASKNQKTRLAVKLSQMQAEKKAVFEAKKKKSELKKEALKKSQAHKKELALAKKIDKKDKKQLEKANTIAEKLAEKKAALALKEAKQRFQEKKKSEEITSKAMSKKAVIAAKNEQVYVRKNEADQRRQEKEISLAEKINKKETKRLENTVIIDKNLALKKDKLIDKRERTLAWQRDVKIKKKERKKSALLEKVERKKQHQIQIAQIITAKETLRKAIYKAKKLRVIALMDRLKLNKQLEMEKMMLYKKDKKEMQQYKIAQIIAKNRASKKIKFKGEVKKVTN